MGMGMGREMDPGSMVVANLLRAWNGRRREACRECAYKSGQGAFWRRYPARFVRIYLPSC